MSATVRQTLVDYLDNVGMTVFPAGTCAEAKQALHEHTPDVAILDYSLPDGNAVELIKEFKTMDSSVPLIVLTAHASIELAVQAVKEGAEQFLTKPVEMSALSSMVMRSVENSRNRHRQAAEQIRQTRQSVDPFLGHSPVIQKLSQITHKIKDADSPILIHGETGTGKGVLAHWFHTNGCRSSQPFVDLNCSGLSREFLETELFGHEKGAFTGAIQRKAGLLEIAHKGTVFLDEIGDVDLVVQPKLLKVLEEKQFRQLGSVRDRRVDIRLIAATHHDLKALVRERKFRGDLFFRINTVTITMPALRERPEDIPLLAKFLLDRLAATVGGGPAELSNGAIRTLQSYSWPGNIRELRNVLERAILLKDGPVLTEADLHFELEELAPENVPTTIMSLKDMEKQSIQSAVFQARGKVEVAARTLGVPRSSLYRKLKEYGLSDSSSTDVANSCVGDAQKQQTYLS